MKKEHLREFEAMEEEVKLIMHRSLYRHHLENAEAYGAAEMLKMLVFLLKEEMPRSDFEGYGDYNEEYIVQEIDSDYTDNLDRLYTALTSVRKMNEDAQNQQGKEK